MPSKKKQCFITGVDSNHQWMLPWWLENIWKHNDTDVVICDFGMDNGWSEWAEKRADHFIKYPKHHKCSWFHKPQTLIDAPYEYKCWIDVDCEVLADISDIFDYVDGTNMGITDDPCRRKEVPNEKWHATGVVVVKDTPDILKIWTEWCNNGWLRGDQEVLHNLVHVQPHQLDNLVEMPMEYQWLRILVAKGQDNPNKKIMHWTGPTGKEIIKKKIEK